MPVRYPSMVWVSVSIFLVSAATIPLAYRLLRRPVVPPRTLTELTARLAKDAPELCVVAVPENRLQDGIYICTQPQPRDRLGRLVRNRRVIGTHRFGRWQGVVFCERVGHIGVISDEELQGWGEYGMQIGPLLFFGDPALLRRIHNAIFDPQGRNAIPKETAKEMDR